MGSESRAFGTWFPLKEKHSQGHLCLINRISSDDNIQQNALNGIRTNGTVRSKRLVIEECQTTCHDLLKIGRKSSSALEINLDAF